MTSYHAVPHTKGGYAVRKGGVRRALSIGLSKAEAWKTARRLARGVRGKAYLSGPDGHIIARNDYAEAEDVAMFKELAKPASIVERLDRILEILNASHGDRR